MKFKIYFRTPTGELDWFPMHGKTHKEVQENARAWLLAKGLSMENYSHSIKIK